MRRVVDIMGLLTWKKIGGLLICIGRIGLVGIPVTVSSSISIVLIPCDLLTRWLIRIRSMVAISSAWSSRDAAILVPECWVWRDVLPIVQRFVSGIRCAPVSG